MIYRNSQVRVHSLETIPRASEELAAEILRDKISQLAYALLITLLGSLFLSPQALGANFSVTPLTMNLLT
jgi:hypothetical protein